MLDLANDRLRFVTILSFVHDGLPEPVISGPDE